MKSHTLETLLDIRTEPAGSRFGNIDIEQDGEMVFDGLTEKNVGPEIPFCIMARAHLLRDVLRRVTTAPVDLRFGLEGS